LYELNQTFFNKPLINLRSTINMYAVNRRKFYSTITDANILSRPIIVVIIIITLINVIITMYYILTILIIITVFLIHNHSNVFYNTQRKHGFSLTEMILIIIIIKISVTMCLVIFKKRFSS